VRKGRGQKKVEGKKVEENTGLYFSKSQKINRKQEKAVATGRKLKKEGVQADVPG